MRKKNLEFWLAFISTVGGLALIGLAVFAFELGLDRSAGWGWARYVALFAGLFVLLCAAALYFWKDAILQAASRIWKSVRESRFTAFFIKYRFALPYVVAVVWVYAWLISSGTWTAWVSPTRYYANLARGFKGGHLYLPSKPDPTLLTLSNPYEPALRYAAGVEAPLDVTYYDGKYYLYWGPVPALLLVAISPFYPGRVGDLQLVFFFVSGVFLLQSLILIDAWNNFFGNLPRWTLSISIALVGLRSPVMSMLGNSTGARIYEAAISGGQFFLIAGLFAAIKWVRAPLRAWYIALASAAWALSIGTRLSLIAPVGVASCMVAWQIINAGLTPRQKILRLAALGIPLTFGLVCLGWYNWARFGSVTESGLYYQFASSNLQKHYANLMSLDYIFQNIYNYFLNPPVISSQFPFLSFQLGAELPIFSAYSLPAIYTAQLLAGLIYTEPFILFALIPFVFWIYPRKPLRFLSDPETARFFKWLTITLGGLFLSAFGFLSTFFWAAARYAEDFMPGLILLSAIGFWQGYSRLSQNTAARNAYALAGLLLAVISAIVSLLLALSVNDARFVLAGLFSP